jgi:hypothetical protein
MPLASDQIDAVLYYYGRLKRRQSLQILLLANGKLRLDIRVRIGATPPPPVTGIVRDKMTAFLNRVDLSQYAPEIWDHFHYFCVEYYPIIDAAKRFRPEDPAFSIPGKPDPKTKTIIKTIERERILGQA